MMSCEVGRTIASLSRELYDMCIHTFEIFHSLYTIFTAYTKDTDSNLVIEYSSIVRVHCGVPVSESAI